jgi:hypothetical protein
MKAISRYAHCDPALAQRLRRRGRQQRWRAKRREKRMEFWSRMERLVCMIGDREAARLLRVRAQNLARNRLMESLGWYNLARARARPRLPSAKKQSADMRSKSYHIRSKAQTCARYAKRRDGHRRFHKSPRCGLTVVRLLRERLDTAPICGGEVDELLRSFLALMEA